MNKKSKIILLIFWFGIHFANKGTCQILKGKILEKETGAPISGIAVYNLNGACITNQSGEYQLDIKKSKVGDQLIIYTYSEALGSTQTSFLYSGDSVFNIYITSVPGTRFLTGKILDTISKKTLANIAVSIISEEYPQLIFFPIYTDKLGKFKIEINKRLFKNDSKVILSISDTSKNYVDTKVLGDLNTYNTINIDRYSYPKSEYLLEVSGYTKTKFRVQPSDIIKIHSTGFVKLGALTGTSGPEGLTTGLMGMSLNSYNLIPELNHGALLYRVNGSKWNVVGTSLQLSNANGFLEFDINDIEKRNNDGSYKVQIIILRN